MNRGGKLRSACGIGLSALRRETAERAVSDIETNII